MATDPIEGAVAPAFFEVTNSWCYRFARYKALPEILTMPEVVAGEPFRLVELSQRVLETHLSFQQRTATFKRAQTGQDLSIAACVKWYIPFIAKQTGLLVRLGGGIYRLPTVEDVDQDEVEEAAIEAGEDEPDEFSGWIYAFSFAALIKEGARYPLKVGKTVVDVDARVLNQCKGSASFDVPQVMGRWQVKRVGAMELAIHNVFKYAVNEPRP